MRFSIRFISNAIALYLALYLVDSLAEGRFLVGSVWIAVFLAVLLAVLNSFIKPLHRLRTRTTRSLVIAALTLAMNLLLIQVFAWATPLHSAGLGWVLLVAAFVSVLAGCINHLVGFGSPKKTRPGVSSAKQTAEKAGPGRPAPKKRGRHARREPSGKDRAHERSTRSTSRHSIGKWFRKA